MAQFLLVWQQTGGCDYTIGCGIRVETVIADDIHDIHPMLARRFANRELSDDIAESIEQVDVYELTGNIARITGAALLTARSEADEKSREDQERADYERLKKKFEK